MQNPLPRRPNFFIVGQPKSGSTALHNFLHAHPDIYMSPYKEPSYFCRDLHAESDAFHNKRIYFPIRTVDQYAPLFEDARQETIVGESSVNYLYSKVAATEIHAYNPDAKILMILRDPVDYLSSFYEMNVRRAWETASTLEEALLLEGKREAGTSIPPNVGFPSTLFYRKRINYYDQARRFLDCFPTNHVKIVLYENFQKNNARVYHEILEFLGVDTSFQPEFRSVNASGAIRYPWLNTLVRNRFVIRLGYTLIPPSKHQLIQRWITKKLITRSPTHRNIDEALRARIINEITPEVERTSSLVGENLLARWGFPPHSPDKSANEG